MIFAWRKRVAGFIFKLAEQTKGDRNPVLNQSNGQDRLTL